MGSDEITSSHNPNTGFYLDLRILVSALADRQISGLAIQAGQTAMAELCCGRLGTVARRGHGDADRDNWRNPQAPVLSGVESSELCRYHCLRGPFGMRLYFQKRHRQLARPGVAGSRCRHDLYQSRKDARDPASDRADKPGAG